MDEDYDLSGNFSSIAATINRLETRIRELETRLAFVERNLTLIPQAHRTGSIGAIKGTLSE